MSITELVRDADSFLKEADTELREGIEKTGEYIEDIKKLVIY